MKCRDRFVNAPSQWETTLHCNVSHLLGAYTKWSLEMKVNIYQAVVSQLGLKSLLIFWVLTYLRLTNTGFNRDIFSTYGVTWYIIIFSVFRSVCWTGNSGRSIGGFSQSRASEKFFRLQCKVWSPKCFFHSFIHLKISASAWHAWGAQFSDALLHTYLSSETGGGTCLKINVEPC